MYFSDVFPRCILRNPCILQIVQNKYISKYNDLQPMSAYVIILICQDHLISRVLAALTLKLGQPEQPQTIM